MAEKLNWGIIGTGHIATSFARGVAHSRTGALVAVGSRRQESADKFGDAHNVPHRHPSYEDLLADGDVEAVYIATPHPMHAEWAIKAAEAGKHILCEKPLSINHATAMAVIEAAHRNGVFLMEAFMYRCHPQTRRLVELVRDGAIGDVRVIQSAFSFRTGWNPEGRLLNNALGGGGILDVGCYCASMSRLIAGAATGQDFAEPISLKACGHVGETNVDEYAIASAEFPGGILAQFATGVQVTQDNVVRIYGTDGWIFVPEPWTPAREGGQSHIFIHRPGQAEPEDIVIDAGWIYGIEADTVAENIENGQAPSPAMTWDDTLGNIRTLDRWRQEIGLVYDGEKAEALTQTVANRPLQIRPDNSMKYGTIPGLDKKVSRLFMGVDNQQTIAHASVMFDDFVEQGGTAFDTAHIYGGGLMERLLGQWVRNRGIRDDVVILGKGAHTPNCCPEALTRELMESLDRLQMDHVDIYMMHRDNPEVPVGEFVDLLNEHCRAGRMTVFGGSNWSTERIDEANAYAAEHGLQGFSAVSNNFSLARMVDAPWAGCVAASTPEYRAWLQEKQMALIPWSSQARGFFTDRAHPDKRDDEQLVRCWYSEDNFQRQARAQELAEKKGVLPIAIALAYVLCQPFPTFPLIGPRLLSETRTSLAALQVDLTPDEVAWLNLEDA